MLETVAGNTFVAAAARILGGALALVSIGVVTRSLGPALFGEYAAILAFLYLWSIASDLGLYQYLLRESSRTGVDEQQLVAQALTLRLAALALFLALGAVSAIFLLPLSLAARLGVPAAAAVFFLQSLAQLGMAPLQKRLWVHWAALGEVAARILQLGLSIAVAALHGGVALFLGVLAAGSLVQIAVQGFVVARAVPLRLAFSLAKTRAILRESLPIAVGLVFTLMYFRLDTVMLSFLRPVEDVGIYNLSYKVLEFLIFFPAMLVGLVMPRLSREAQEDKAAFSQTLQKLFDVIVFAAVPMLVGGLATAPLLVRVLGGGGFAEAADPLRILLVAAALIFAGAVFGHSVIALGQQKKAVWVYGGGMVFNFIANLIFIPRYTYIAAAASTVATEFLVTLGLVALTFAAAGRSVHLKSFLRAVPAAGIMVVPLLTLPWAERALGAAALLPYVVVCPVIYIAALRMFGGITAAHMALLRGKPQT